ncbi:hypothetical protein [Paractinoplanes hotanensis]|uniref:WXG100 family type VII secretion target n=1 Tax=Paractinoplanes hotanensis TaxID=2906497 RepID=A0ABT0XW85_9ACTN|nr:hypothetical protein [Actinoplanes hotanensis]MCM4078055.1 hypothetical protein [Actinoplanes hotanensis]
MTQPRGRLFVDPDGVVSVGDAYDEHVQMYDTYLANLVALRERYANAWGDDDMGRQFSTKFLDGLDNLEGLIGGVRGTLSYTSEGLRSFGKAYAEADESAREVGLRMAGDFEESFAPKTRHALAARVEPAQTVEGEPLPGLQPTRMRGAARAEEFAEGELRPAFLSRRAAIAPIKGDHVEGERQPAFLSGRATLTPVEGFVESELQPAFISERAAIEPIEGESLPAFAPSTLTPASPMMPAISSMMLKPEYAEARIGGEPLPPGYRLQALNPFPDGTTRVDANLYESITPLAGTPVTTADGRPIDPEGRQLFVVRENPAADATAPGYQPLVLSYAPDGTPSPLIPGDA